MNQADQNRPNGSQTPAAALPGADAEYLLRESIAAAGVGIWEWDVRSDAVRWSAELKAMFGLPLEAPVSRQTLLDALDPEQAEQARCALPDALARRADYRASYRIQRPDGEERWIESCGRGEYDGAGQPLRMVGVVRDITATRRAEALRDRSEHGFRTLVETISQFIWYADVQGRIISISAALRQHTGIDPEQIEGERWQELLHPDDYAGARAAWAEAVASHRPFSAEFRLRVPPAGYRYFLGQAIDLGADLDRAAAVAAPRWLGMLSDIDDRKRAELALRASEQKLESILDCMNEMVWSVSVDDDELVYCSPLALQITGYPAADFIADRGLWLAVVLPEDRVAVRHGMSAALKTGAFDLEYRFVHADGRIRWVRNRGRAIRGPSGRVLRLDGTIADVTEHRQRQEQLDYLSYFDPLTGLANQRNLIERLNQLAHSAGVEGPGFAVLLADAVHFKSVNDTLGMLGGDELLKRLARRLLRLAGNQVRLARVGGDRFAMVVAGARSAADLAPLLRERLWQVLDRPYRVHERELRVAVRIGIALYPADGVAAEALLQNAEAALKKAKSTGERFLFYAPAMTDELKRRLELESGLRLALERGEFELHYQARADLRGGGVCAAEALLRWNRPDAGLLGREQFLGALEDSGLVAEVGRWILQQVAADLGRWRAQGLPVVPVSIKLAPQQLRQADLAAHLGELLGSPEAQGLQLQVEVAESLFAAELEQKITVLQALRRLGVTVIIAGFGAGYSSLANLSRLPIDALKIDSSFVAAMTDHATNMGIVSTIISLARSMNLRVIAEGVDGAEQLKFLRLLRCDEMQGPLFSAPLPAAQFARLLGSGASI